MKKILIVLLFMMCIITGCVNEKEITYTSINIDDYHENIDNYIDEYVEIKGFWIDGHISEYLSENSINLNLSEDLLYYLNSRLVFKQTIHVYGKMTLNNNKYVFKTDKIMDYDNTLSERVWSNSYIIDSGQAIADMINNDKTKNYEFTATAISDEPEVIIDGLGFIIKVDGIKAYTGDTFRLLITEFEYDFVNDKYTAICRACKKIDGEVLFNE